MHLSYASRQQLFFKARTVARAVDTVLMRQHGTTCTMLVQGIKPSAMGKESNPVVNYLCI